MITNCACDSLVQCFSIGTLVDLDCAFADAGGITPLDPTTITLFIKLPNGTILPPLTYAAAEITRTGLGTYEYGFTPTMPGLHYYRYEGTGACQVQIEGRFNVLYSAII